MVYRLRQWAGSLTGFVVIGVASIGIVALIATYFVVMLSSRYSVDGFPLVLTTQQVLEESTRVFAIPVDETNIHYGHTYNPRTPYNMQSFVAADDGTFWIIDVSNRLLHYSSEGALLAQVPVPEPLVDSNANLLDVVARGSTIWILAFVEPFKGSMPATIFKLSYSGEELARHTITDDSPVRYGTMIFGEHGEILLYNPDVDPQLWQLLDDAGRLDIRPRLGYTSQGKFYSARLDEPDNRYNRSATIQSGNVNFSISITEPNIILSGACICHLNPDGSFYLFTEEWNRNSRHPPHFRSILFYSGDGTPLARVPEVLAGDRESGSWLWMTSSWNERLSVRADGSIYLLKATPQEGLNTTSFEVYRLKFGQASK